MHAANGGITYVLCYGRVDTPEVLTGHCMEAVSVLRVPLVLLG